MRTRILYGVFIAVVVGYGIFVGVTRDPNAPRKPRTLVGKVVAAVAGAPAPVKRGSRLGPLPCVALLPPRPTGVPPVATTHVGRDVADRLGERLNVTLSDDLNEDQRDLALYSRLFNEVGVDGFSGMFNNSIGRKGVRMRGAVARIGPPEFLAIYDCALTAFPNSQPSERDDQRFDQLDAWQDRNLFRGLDDRLVDLMGSRQLEHAMDEFVASHPAL